MVLTGRELGFLIIIGLLTISCFGIAVGYEQKLKKAQQPCINLPEKQFLFCTEIDDSNNWLATVKNQDNPNQTAEWVKDFCEKTIGCGVDG